MIIRTYLNGKERLETNQIIKEKTGYLIKSKSILNQIFRRSSMSADFGGSSNEIFEFIGDQVLSYYVVKIVSKKCGSLSIMDDYTFRICENRFTFIKQLLINNETLAKIIDDWDLAKYLLVSRSDIKNEVIKEQKVKADLLESIIGAIAIETDWNEEILETAVAMTLNISENIEQLIESDTKVRHINIDNAVTTLKEFAESGLCTPPKYEFTGPEYIGYDSDGNPKWFCSGIIINEKVGLSRSVCASSKKDAKKAVAYLLLCEQLNMQNKYGPNDWYIDWTYKDGKLSPNRQQKD